jgi:hypothetical protein
VHEQVREGMELEVRGPRNRFPLVDAPSYVFVAGGIGITPILPMLRALTADGADWRLLYGGRSRASMPFLEEVVKLGGMGVPPVRAESGTRGRVSVVAEDEDGLPDLDAWLGELPGDAAVYCCGPEGLMAAVAERVPRVHMERFTPRAATGGAFEVELRRSGRVLTVPADTTVLDAVREELPETDVLVMAAAPADFRPSDPSDRKRARVDGALAIPMEPTEDILGATRGLRKQGSITVGFALETGDALAKGRAKLERKDLDLIVVNDALEPGAGSATGPETSTTSAPRSHAASATR